MASKEVIVLGAGVIGLQTAVTLLEAGYTVSVVAQYLPGDEHAHYTSPWAGAVWRTHASRDEKELCAWDAETYGAWKELVTKEDREGRHGESGLKMLPAVQYWDDMSEEIKHGVSSIWWRSVVDDFRVLPNAELPAGVHFGASYTTFTVNVPRYLSYLVCQIQRLGGCIHRATLPMDRGLETTLNATRAVAKVDSVFAFVNASGLAAKWLAKDDAVDVVQGQTVLVRGEAKRHVARLGADVYDVVVTIPRLGANATVVGSSRNPGSWETKPDGEVTRRLLEAGKRLAPELLNEMGEFDVIRENVGLRPYRKGGPRVELETLPEGQVVVHEYAHGGAGYQNSVGSARKVLRLLDEHKKAANAMYSRL